MKESEKLDAILRYLHDRKDDGREHSLLEILTNLNIQTNTSEVARLAESLKKDGHIHLNDLSRTLKKAKITSLGIRYCEDGSNVQRGIGIVHNYHISNSPQANIIVKSNQVSVNQTQHENAMEIIRLIREAIATDESVDQAKRTEILECTTEVESSLERQKIPKFALRSLLTMGSEISSISSLLVSLAQLLQIGA